MKLQPRPSMPPPIRSGNNHKSTSYRYSLPLNIPKSSSPCCNMAAPQDPTPSVHHVLLQIIVSDSSMTSSLEKYTTAAIPVSFDMGPQDLEVQLNLLFQDDLFGIKKQIPNREVHFAIWSIRWNDVSVLPDMVMIKKLDFERGLALMQARGWRDTLVVRCELKRKGWTNQMESLQAKEGNWWRIGQKQWFIMKIVCSSEVLRKETQLSWMVWSLKAADVSKSCLCTYQSCLD